MRRRTVSVLSLSISREPRRQRMARRASRQGRPCGQRCDIPVKRLVSYGGQARDRGGSHETSHHSACGGTLRARLGFAGHGCRRGFAVVAAGHRGLKPDSQRADARRLDVRRLRQRRQRPRLHLAAVHPEAAPGSARQRRRERGRHGRLARAKQGCPAPAVLGAQGDRGGELARQGLRLGSDLRVVPQAGRRPLPVRPPRRRHLRSRLRLALRLLRRHLQPRHHHAGAAQRHPARRRTHRPALLRRLQHGQHRGRPRDRQIGPDRAMWSAPRRRSTRTASPTRAGCAPC